MRIFFSAGEPSGDLHGANLVRELTTQDPTCECVGFGGPKMSEAGVQLQADLTKLAVMWFLRALLNIHRFLQLLLQADRYFRDSHPDAVVLIDYPGFNWWVARRAKAHGIPVFYYGAPQMWAWASWRIGKMRRLVDHVLCKLPFEAEWYRARGCNATYVGHPYFDETRRQELDTAFLAKQDALPGRLITLLPGSRTQEVTANLEAFLKTVEKLSLDVPQLRFAIACFNERQAAIAEQASQNRSVNVDVYVHRTPELIQAASACLACSGSVSLELLHYVKPTVVHYKIGRFAFLVQRLFRKVRFITLVNLLATEDRYCRNGEQYDPRRDTVPFPEYLTCRDRSTQMVGHLKQWLTDPQRYATTQHQLESLKRSFAIPGASRTAAAYILGRGRGTYGEEVRDRNGLPQTQSAASTNAA